MKIKNKKIHILSCLAESLGMKLCYRPIFGGYSLCMCIDPICENTFHLIDTNEFEDDEPINAQSYQVFCFTSCHHDFNILVEWMRMNLKDKQRINEFISGFHFDDFDSLELDLVLSGKFRSSNDYEVDLESV